MSIYVGYCPEISYADYFRAYTVMEYLPSILQSCHATLILPPSRLISTENFPQRGNALNMFLVTIGCTSNCSLCHIIFVFLIVELRSESSAFSCSSRWIVITVSMGQGQDTLDILLHHLRSIYLLMSNYKFKQPFEPPVEACTSFYAGILAQKATRLGRSFDPGW